MSLRRDSRIQSSFVVEKVVGVVKCFQQSKAFANNWIKQNEKKIIELVIIYKKWLGRKEKSFKMVTIPRGKKRMMLNLLFQSPDA
jgi:hypothetical protein